MTDIQQLYHGLLQPSDVLVSEVAKLKGDILILGVGGKMGPALARLAKQAVDKAGVNKKIIGVARFSEEGLPKELNEQGIE
ncbi:MAG: epimerase, partial [Bacteroidota bacterium]|nr:epimerase [Bacteroidota bacterium]